MGITLVGFFYCVDNLVFEAHVTGGYMLEATMVEENVVDAQDQVQEGQPAPLVDNAEKADENLPEKLRGKSREEIAQIYVEVEKKLGQMGGEIGTLHKELENVREKNQLAEVVARLATPKEPEKPKTDWDSVKKQYVEKYGEDTGSAMYEALATANSWIREDVTAAKTEFERTKKELELQLNALKAQQITFTSEYRENKEWVDKLVEGGMSIDKAVKVAAEIGSAIPRKAVDRIQPPMGVNGTRKTMVEKKPEPYVTEAEKQQYLASGMTQEQIDTMEAEYQERKARGVK